MQPPDPLQPPITPVTPQPQVDPLKTVDPATIAHGHKRDNLLDGPDPKKNPFGEHISRPHEVPLARPEYVHPDQAIPVAPNADIATQQAYQYITQSGNASNQPSALANSVPKRIALVVAGLLLLIILFSVGKNALSTGPKLDEVVASMQRQQEILHVLGNALQETSLSTSNKNFALTAQLALGTSQSQLIAYVQDTGMKLTPQILALKLNTTVDTQLTASATNNAYNPTFKDIMITQLTAYQNGLNTAYDQDTGAKGRALIKDDFIQSKLLLEQLQTPAI